MKRFFVIMLTIIWVILNGKVAILEQTESSITIEIDFTDYEITNDENYTHIYAENWDGSEITGAPDIPRKIMNFIVPDNGDINYSIISIDSYREVISKPIVPVPNIFEFNETNKYTYQINEDKYRSEFNGILSEGELSHYRYYNYIPLTFKPVSIVNDREINICRKLILQVDITGNRSVENPVEDKFRNIYSDLFTNYSQGKNWKSKAVKKFAKIPFEKSDFWYTFEVEQDGIFRLSADELSILPQFHDPSSIRIFTMDRFKADELLPEYDFELIELPLSIHLDQGEIFFNYNKNEQNLPRFSESDKFWLTFGGNFDSAPLRSDMDINEIETKSVSDFSASDHEVERGQNRSVNCLYIYPQDFLTQTQSLAQFHSELYNISAALVDQQEIFIQYSGGEADPIAIKNYINEFWQDLPEEDSLKYVILVGSGTHDWLNSTEKNRIMTFGNSDDNFVTFSAVFAELIISRIPAQNEEDLDFYLERLQHYVEEPLPGWWRNTMVMMADDENKDGEVEGFTSNSGLNHTNLAQQTQNALHEGFFVDKVLGLEYNFDEYNNKPDARDALIEKVDKGCLIWYFIGHGNPDVLGDEDYFRGSQHLRLLDNELYLPLFLAASCSVGEFDSPSFDCIAEKLLFLDNGGSIASLAASRECSGTANTTILKEFLRKIVNERYSLGDALYHTKTTTTYISTAKKYNLLGDPLMDILPPLVSGSFTNIPDSIRAREQVEISGEMNIDIPFNGEGVLRVFDSEYDVYYTHTLNDHTYDVTYQRNGSTFYKGGVELTNNDFGSTFIVPDDVRFGDQGKMINYVYDEVQNKNYITYASDINLSSIPVNSVSYDSPSVSLWLDSRGFLSGDYVSASPVLIAELEDSNGINILGSAGHKILLLLDDAFDPIDVTEYFSYYTGSFTQGELQWQIQNLEEGYHFLQLIVFDNFNNPTIAETEFRVRKSGNVSIEQMLVYPNPISKDGHFTFVVTEDSEVVISIYTITGRKIKTIDKQFCESGYNQIYWDGKDGDGDEIANNTYFYKIKAKQLGNSKVTEKIGKLIILK